MYSALSLTHVSTIIQEFRASEMLFFFRLAFYLPDKSRVDSASSFEIKALMSRFYFHLSPIRQNAFVKTSYSTSTESERGAYWSEYEMCLQKVSRFSETYEHPTCEYLFCHIELVASRWYIMLYWYSAKSGDTGWHVCHLSTSGSELSASCLQRQRPQHETPVYKDNKKRPICNDW